MTMSTSSAPASTAARTSATLMSRNVWPDGNPVATLATLTVEPLSASFASATSAGIDAHRGDGRDRRVARLRAHRLDAHRPDLARRVLSLEGRQVHHRDRELERPQLRRLLDRAALERIDALLDADLVDRGDPAEQAAERPRAAVPGTDQLVGARTGRRIGASRGGHGTERIHPVSERVHEGTSCSASARRGPWGAAEGRACRRSGSGGTTTPRSRRFSTRRNGVPERVSSWVSSGTRSSRTGRRSERRTVNSASAWAIVVRRSRSECWISSGVRIASAYAIGEISRK